MNIFTEYFSFSLYSLVSSSFILLNYNNFLLKAIVVLINELKAQKNDMYCKPYLYETNNLKTVDGELFTMHCR